MPRTRRYIFNTLAILSLLLLLATAGLWVDSNWKARSLIWVEIPWHQLVRAVQLKLEVPAA